MPIEVVPYDPTWPATFASLASELRSALDGVAVLAIEHVGSTSVPGLAAKPVIDIDIIVRRENVSAAIEAAERMGYTHQGDLGLADRESLRQPPGSTPRRNLYICVEGTLHLRNHLAVRDTLRRSTELRDAYAAVKLALGADPSMDINKYLAGKTAVVLQVLEESDLTDAEKEAVRRLNDP